MGWILDGYPLTLNQAVLLEKAVSGYDGTAMAQSLELDHGDDTNTNVSSHQSVDTSSQQQQQHQSVMKKSRLLSDPRPAPASPPPVSGLDAVILLDVSDELCLLRATDMPRT